MIIDEKKLKGCNFPNLNTTFKLIILGEKLQ